jgi:hypothetical protein
MNASISFNLVSTLCCFVFSVVAAGIAINLYSLLRTGQIGASWRILIIASVLFALVQAVKLAEVLRAPAGSSTRLSALIELVFVLALAYAFFLQRQVFSEAHHTLRHEDRAETEEEEAVVSTYERYS